VRAVPFISSFRRLAARPGKTGARGVATRRAVTEQGTGFIFLEGPRAKSHFRRNCAGHENS
jgi:hypothetical protein